MAIWAPLIAAGAQLGSAAIKSESNKDTTEALGELGGDLQTPGFHKSGNVTDQRGFLGKANNFLGSEVGSIVKGVGSQFLGDFRQRRANKNRFSDLKDEGLTAQEIAGGSSGGSVQAQGNTLGSGPMRQAQNQQAFQSSENAKQRAHELRKIEASKEVPRRQVSLSENIQPVQIQKLHRDMAHTLKQMEQIDFNMDTAFPMKFATMAPENMLAAVVAARSGVDMEALLRGRKVTAQQSQAMDDMFEMTQIVLAKGRRELKGTMDVVKAVSAYSFDNFPTPPAPDATKLMEMLMNLFERDPSQKREPRTNLQKSNPLDKKFWNR